MKRCFLSFSGPSGDRVFVDAAAAAVAAAAAAAAASVAAAAAAVADGADAVNKNEISA